MMLTALIPLTLLLLSSTSGQIYPASSDVAELNDETFKEFVLSRDGVVLAEFYAPWCGHCKALTNDYNKVAKALKGVADVVAIDATANEKIAKKYQVGALWRNTSKYVSIIRSLSLRFAHLFSLRLRASQH